MQFLHKNHFISVIHVVFDRAMYIVNRKALHQKRQTQTHTHTHCTENGIAAPLQRVWFRWIVSTLCVGVHGVLMYVSRARASPKCALPQCDRSGCGGRSRCDCDRCPAPRASHGPRSRPPRFSCCHRCPQPSLPPPAQRW